MITSKDNERLKLIRKLADKKHRDRERLFVAEGEDLIEAAAAADWPAEFVLHSGDDVEPALLDAVSSLGSGSRVIGVYRQRWATEPSAPATYLHGIGDPANVGAVIRSAHALSEGTVVIGPGCADPYAPKAVRASMGSVFAQPLVRAAIDATPKPRAALVAHGGETPVDPGAVATICLGGERQGLPGSVLAQCDQRWTIALRPGGAESLNVAAAAAITLGWISSAAVEGGLKPR